jgi:PST family polysaccharide transporter
MVLQVFTYLAPFLVLSYLTRVLGVETYGVVAFGISITQVGAVFVDLGFTLSATEKISVWRKNKRFVNRLIGAIFAIKCIALMLVASGICVYALNSVKYKTYSTLIILSTLSLFAQCFQPIWFFFGIERMRYITIFTIATKIAYLPLILMLVSRKSDYLWVPVADGISQVAGTAIAIYLIYQTGYGIVIPRRRDIMYAARMTSGFFVSRLAVMTYSNTGVLLLGLFLTPSATAIYALAGRLYLAMQQVFVPLVQALYPYLAKEKNVALLRKVTISCMGVAILGVVVGYATAPYLVLVLFGPAWGGVVKVLNVFFAAILIYVLNVMVGYPLAAALNRTSIANSSVVCGALVYFVGAVALLMSGRATPVLFAYLMVVAELSVLGYRGVILWPEARRALETGQGRKEPI